MVKKKDKKEDMKKAVVKDPSELEREALIQETEDLINQIRPKLLTNLQMKQGGSGVRERHVAEAGYQKCFDEINARRVKVGLKPIGIGHIRK